jgi:hypothetical protein
VTHPATVCRIPWLNSRDELEREVVEASSDKSAGLERKHVVPSEEEPHQEWMLGVDMDNARARDQQALLWGNEAYGHDGVSGTNFVSPVHGITGSIGVGIKARIPCCTWYNDLCGCYGVAAP